MLSLGGHAEARGTVECRVVVWEPRALGCSQKSSTLGVGPAAHEAHTCCLNTLCACTVGGWGLPCDVGRGLDLLGMVGSAHSRYVTAGCFCGASMCSCDVCCPCTAWVGHAEARGTVECRVVVLEPRALGCSQKSSTLGVGSEDRAHSGHTPVKIHCFQHKHICGRVMHLLHVSAGWRLLHDWRVSVIRVFTAHQQPSGAPMIPW